MEKNKKHRFRKIPTIALFAIAAFIIIYFIPREAKYQYSYMENRPWQYGLLTAPFNFYVHKSADNIKAEEDSIMQLFQPYYLLDVEVPEQNISLFEEDAKAHSAKPEYVQYISRKLAEIYKAGIISVDNYELISKQNKKQLLVSNANNIFTARHIASFYTPRLAYDKLMNDAPLNLDLDIIKELKLNDYLNVNILYDEDTSNKAKKEMLKQIALYEGEVQQGQRIIDRGEIVTAKTKNILDSYSLVWEEQGGNKSNPIWLIIGEIIIVLLALSALHSYMRFYRMREYSLQKNIIFILLVIVIFAVIVGLMMSSKQANLVYIIPFAIPTILVRTFLDSRTAMTTHIVLILICSVMIPVDQIAQFIIIQLLVGYTSVFSLHHLAERSQLIYTSIFILLTYIITYTGWVLATEGDIMMVVENKWIYVYFCINFVLVSFAYILVYIFERIFGFISEVTMIELSNTNTPLLQRLSEAAPGTFQHSMQVSNLVVAAAQRIGANPALARVGALYHDIGKMTNAAFFTENQTQGMNPHAGLDEKESAKIILGHVEEGVKIAKKNNLPQQIIDFIESHHGRGRTKYFYNTYVNKHPDEVVNKSDFTYKGRNPFSKETALLMMADTVEAASRSLPEYTPEAIRALVDKLIDEQMDDGMFKYAPITFQDVENVKDIFCDKLSTIYHSRISYPELNKKEETEKLN